MLTIADPRGTLHSTGGRPLRVRIRVKITIRIFLALLPGGIEEPTLGRFPGYFTFPAKVVAKIFVGGMENSGTKRLFFARFSRRHAGDRWGHSSDVINWVR